MHLFEIKIILSVLIGLLWFVIPLFKRFVCTQKVTAHIDKTTIKSGEMDSDGMIDLTTYGMASFSYKGKNYRVKLAHVSEKHLKEILYIWDKHPKIFIRKESVLEILKPIGPVLLIVLIFFLG